MAIVINEIEINIEVAAGASNAGSSTATVNSGSKDEIIKECVEKVMEIINQKNER